MSAYPLKAVLGLRRREEEAAAARLADATRERVTAEAEEARLVMAVSAARQRWENASRNVFEGSGGRRDGGRNHQEAFLGSVAADLSRFVDRRRSEHEQAEAHLRAFRSGALAQARNAETSTRAFHIAARQAREALDKHEARFRAGERTVHERREEEALDDIVRATRHPGSRGRP